MKKRLILAIGTNVNQENNIIIADKFIEDYFGKENVAFSKAMWTNPIGIISDRFLNQLACINTNDECENVIEFIKSIERKMHSTKKKKYSGVVVIDIDLLEYDNVRYHNEDWNRKYIKELMSTF